ncbi:MAG TPA: DUF3175 domain-containing protein [Burkholderiales bacterium]|nr:DUF3175 domain-containing protein [Burkholderiales bacterium]
MARVKNRKQRVKRWSARVTRESDALDLEAAVFKKKNASEIARSLKRSAEKSERRNTSPFRSAMSMLTFYINRAGDNLSASRTKTLERAKDELRKLYGRSVASKPRKSTKTGRSSEVT